MFYHLDTFLKEVVQVFIGPSFSQNALNHAAALASMHVNDAVQTLECMMAYGPVFLSFHSQKTFLFSILTTCKWILSGQWSGSREH